MAWRGEKPALGGENSSSTLDGMAGTKKVPTAEMLRKLKKTTLNSLFPSVSLFSNYTDSGAAARVILI